MRIRSVVLALAVAIIMVLPLTLVPVHASQVSHDPVRDDFNYNSSNPDATVWDEIIQENEDRQNDCASKPCHDMWVAEPPGYLFSDNKACKATIESPTSYTSGCGADARMRSFRKIDYDTARGQSVILRERFSPNIHNPLFCITALLPVDWELMHAITVRYSDVAPGAAPLVQINVHHNCRNDGWKFFTTISYMDRAGNLQGFEAWKGRVIDNDDWLSFQIEVRDNGSEARFSMYIERTGETFTKTVGASLGARNGPMETVVQYRHNERSRTDFVDFRLTQSDCGSLADAGDSFGAAMFVVPSVLCDASLSVGPDSEDWYQFPVQSGQVIAAAVGTGPAIELYKPDGSRMTSFNNGATVPADVAGSWRVRIYSTGWSGTYDFRIDVTWPTGLPHGGGCGPHECDRLSPYLSTYDGTGWHLDNNLLPQSLNLGWTAGTDVTDSYELQKPLASTDGAYQLKIQQLGLDRGYFDRIRLLAVDHDTEAKVGVTPTGDILTYRSPSPPALAVNSLGLSVTGPVARQNDGLYYQATGGDWLMVEFSNQDVSEAAKLLVRSGGLERQAVTVQVFRSAQWANVTVLPGRTFLSLDLVDLKAYLPDAEGRIRARLSFSDSVLVDYVGFDGTPQAMVTVMETVLVTANHSGGADVTSILIASDDEKVRLLPSEGVFLTFNGLNAPTGARDFIIISEGYYESIT